MWFKKKEKEEDQTDVRHGMTMREVFEKLGVKSYGRYYPYITEFGVVLVGDNDIYDLYGNKIVENLMINHDNLDQFKKGTSSVDIVVNAIKNNTSDINGAINNTISRRGNEPEKS